MTQPDIYDLLAEAEADTPDLVIVRVRDDARGYVASDAGLVISDPMPRADAEAVVRSTPNGAQMRIVPSTTCPRCDHRHSIGGNTTVAGSRFTRPITYRARYPDAPTRTTREQAIQDMCDHRAAQHTARNDEMKEHRA